MKRLVIFLPLLLIACESEPNSSEATENSKLIDIPNEKEIKKEANAQARDVLRNRAPKWSIEYKGAYNGKIEGGIMSVVSVSTTTVVAGGAMSDDKKSKAKRDMKLSIMSFDKAAPYGNLSMTLDDGTRCKMDPKAPKSTVDVEDADRKTFKATAKGSLICGEDGKPITYVATFNKKP